MPTPDHRTRDRAAIGRAARRVAVLVLIAAGCTTPPPAENGAPPSHGGAGTAAHGAPAAPSAPAAGVRPLDRAGPEPAEGLGAGAGRVEGRTEHAAPIAAFPLPDNRAQVRAVLDRALDAHGRALLALRDSFAKLELRFRRQDGRGLSDATVREWYRARDHYAYQIAGIPNAFTQGYDGAVAWARTERGVTRFEGPHYEQERREILSRLAVRRLFFLVELHEAHQQGDAVTALGPHPFEDSPEGGSDRLELLSYREPETGGRHCYGFEQSSGRLVRAWIRGFPAFDGGAVDVRVDFSAFRRFRSGASGDGPDELLLPTLIEGAYLDPAGRPLESGGSSHAFTARLAASGAPDTPAGGVFRFNAGLADRTFRPPTR